MKTIFIGKLLLLGLFCKIMKYPPDVGLTVKTFILAALISVAIHPSTQARGGLSFKMPELMSGSHLAFVGKVTSVNPSGLTTALTYPTWKGATFEWLKVEVQVVYALKGTKKGAIVRTLLLSAPDGGPMLNPPGMVDVKVGQKLLMFLHPTTKEGVYASMSAPWDDDQAIFVLNRKHAEQNLTSIYLMKLIPKLIDENGGIILGGVNNLREDYKKQLAVPGPKTAIIHLKWKAQSSQKGWQWDVPDSEDSKNQKPIGPVTR